MALTYLETQTRGETRYGKGPLIPAVVNFAAFELIRFDSKILHSNQLISQDTREIAEGAAIFMASQYGSDAAFADAFQAVTPSLHIVPRVLNNAEEFERVTRTNPGPTADFLVAANLFGDREGIQHIMQVVTPDSSESISPVEINDAVAFRRTLLGSEQGLPTATEGVEPAVDFSLENEFTNEAKTKDPHEIARRLIEDISIFAAVFPAPREAVLRFFPELGPVIDRHDLKQRGSNGKIELTKRQFWEAMTASRFRGVQQKVAKKAIEDELLRIRKDEGR